MNLFRTLRQGAEYNPLFPDSSCEKVRMSKGDTHASVNDMIKQIKKFNYQTTKVARLLKGKDVQETCYKIHDFLYNHFQYKADTNEQLLRSPACAWKTRYDGIDCKSYSIIASCLLLNLELKHYIRKIKQPTFSPQEYTHVYVIVPVDQQKGSLKKGYYTIDGTLPHTNEPTNIETKDYFMEGLQHFGLNGILDAIPGGSTATTAIDWGKKLKNAIQKLSLKNIGNIKCWGGVGFNDATTQGHVQAFNTYIANELLAISKGIAEGANASVISTHINNVIVAAPLIWWNFEAKKGEGWNECSRGNMESIQEMVGSFADTTKIQFMKWVDYYFDAKDSESINIIASDFSAAIGMWPNENKNGITGFSYIPKNYTLKTSIKEVALFEFTPYTLDTVASKFNVSEFIKTAETFLPINNGYVANNSNNIPKKKDDTKDNTPLILVGVAIVGFFGYKYLKN